MSTWIDFKKLREQLNFTAVLRHYKIEVKPNKTQHTGLCPLPQHRGKQRSPSFSANLEKGIFQCFHCGAKGNLLDFAVLIENGNPENSDDVRKTAFNLQKTFGLAENAKPKAPKKEPKPQQSESKLAVVNEPLDFELKTLDFGHPYLRNLGFSEETIRAYGLGFCSKGYHAGRIAIPLRCQRGQLIGYAGRIVDNSLICEATPRYRFPSARERNGITYEFHKSEFLYDGHRIKAPVDDLIVVEGFPSVWWLQQNKIRHAVGLMGWSMSEAQAALVCSLVKPQGRVWLMPDGDESGERCAECALPQISPHRLIRWVKLEKDKQPTDYTGACLRELLNP